MLFLSAYDVYTDTHVSPHWINTPTPQETRSLETTDLPIWSVNTFASASNLNKCKENNSTSSIDNVSANPNTDGANPSAHNANSNKVVPKRVAPPPPKSKSRKKGKAEPSTTSEPAEYAVPVVSHGWFGRKKKPSKYKELNLNQMQAPSTYTAPQISNQNL